MGKSLIIKGADFSANAVVTADTYYMPETIFDETNKVVTDLHLFSDENQKWIMKVAYTSTMPTNKVEGYIFCIGGTSNNEYYNLCYQVYGPTQTDKEKWVKFVGDSYSTISIENRHSTIYVKRDGSTISYSFDNLNWVTYDTLPSMDSVQEVPLSFGSPTVVGQDIQGNRFIGTIQAEILFGVTSGNFRF